MIIFQSGNARRPCEIAPPVAPATVGHEIGKKLRGKVVLINACDTALASLIACQLASEGARVTLCNLPRDSDASAIPRALAAQGFECRVVDDRCDGRQACRRLVENIVSELGAIDVLINCGSADNLQADEVDGIEAVFRSSTFPYFYLMAAVLPYLPEGGSIINSSTLHCRRPSTPDQAAAESAIVALTQSFSTAAARRGVRVNAVSRSSDGARSAHHHVFSGVDPGSETAAFFAGSAWLFLACSESNHINGKTFSLNASAMHEAA